MHCRFLKAENSFQFHHQWLPAPDVHEEDEDNDRGQLDQGDGNKAGGGVAPSEKFEIHLHLLPDIGILSEVDLVSTERKERLKMGRKKMQFPT